MATVTLCLEVAIQAKFSPRIRFIQCPPCPPCSPRETSPASRPTSPRPLTSASVAEIRSVRFLPEQPLNHSVFRPDRARSFPCHPYQL
jgi:hypothetical protein